MIVKLIKDINEAIDLNFLDKKYGLTFPNSVTIPVPGNAQTKNKVLPFEWGNEQCNADSAVVPDERYRSVSWFEGNDNIQKERLEGGQYLNVTAVRMVVWSNLKKIDHEDPEVADSMVNLLEKAISDLKFSSASHNLMRTGLRKVTLDHKAILSKYSFDDRAKLMVFPYFIFAIDFDIAFTSKLCAPITLNPC